MNLIFMGSILMLPGCAMETSLTGSRPLPESHSEQVAESSGGALTKLGDVTEFVVADQTASSTIQKTDAVSEFSLKFYLKSNNIQSFGNIFLLKGRDLSASYSETASSFYLSIQNSGSRSCTPSNSTVFSTYIGNNWGDGPNGAPNIEFSLSPVAMAIPIAPGQVQYIPVSVKTQTKSATSYVFNNSQSGILGALNLRCAEDSSKSSLLTLAFVQKVNVSSIGERACYPGAAVTQFINDREINPDVSKYPRDTPLLVQDGQSVHHVIRSSTSNVVSLRRNGFYFHSSESTFGSDGKVKLYQVPSVMMEGNCADYHFKNPFGTGLLLIENKKCGKLVYSWYNNPDSRMAVIGFKDGSVVINSNRGIKQYVYGGGDVYDANSATSEIRCSPYSAAAFGPSLHTQYFGW